MLSGSTHLFLPVNCCHCVCHMMRVAGFVSCLQAYQKYVPHHVRAIRDHAASIFSAPPIPLRLPMVIPKVAFTLNSSRTRHCSCSWRFGCSRHECVKLCSWQTFRFVVIGNTIGSCHHQAWQLSSIAPGSDASCNVCVSP